jgi:hypothetical protein
MQVWQTRGFLAPQVSVNTERKKLERIYRYIPSRTIGGAPGADRSGWLDMR